MRKVFSPHLCLRILIIVTACQKGSNLLHMDGASQATIKNYSPEEKKHDMVDERCQDSVTQCVTPQVASLSAKSAYGVLLSMGELTDPSASLSNLKVLEQDLNKGIKTKEAIPQSPSDFLAWFYAFIDAVNDAEKWSDVEEVLEEGKKCQYLFKTSGWEDDEYNPLHYAAQVGDEEVVKELVEKYSVPVDLKTGIFQRTPLHLAALRGHISTVRYLVSKEAHWGSTDYTSANVLHYAALGMQGRENTEVVRFFLDEMGIDPTVANNMLPGKINLLHLAIEAENVTLVQYLLQNYPSLARQQDENGTSPKDLAKTEVIKEIIEEHLGLTDPCEQLSKNCVIH